MLDVLRFEDQIVLVGDEKIKERWNYFQNLLNENDEGNISDAEASMRNKKLVDHG